MNNIKFKAWDNDKKQMAKVKAIDWDCNDNIITCHLEYGDGSVEKKYPEKDYGDDIVFFQYTGIKDKNGKEIYEGDVVKSLDEKIAYATFLQQEMGYVLVYEKYDKRLGHRNTGSDYNSDNNLKIIGNIFKNPELLK